MKKRPWIFLVLGLILALVAYGTKAMVPSEVTAMSEAANTIPVSTTSENIIEEEPSDPSEQFIDISMSALLEPEPACPCDLPPEQFTEISASTLPDSLEAGEDSYTLEARSHGYFGLSSEMDGVASAEEAEAVLPSVTVTEQEIENGTVAVQQVISDGPGWIVIYAKEDGAPGPVIGRAAVSDGKNADVRVDIDTEAATEILYAMLHADTGEIGIYEFPDADLPVKVDGETIMQPFTLVMPSETDVAVQSPVNNPPVESSVIDNPGDYLPPDVNYARVTYEAPVYSSLEAVREGDTFTYHGGDVTWVNVRDSQTVDGQQYHYATWAWDMSGWIPADALSFTQRLSRLRGIDFQNYQQRVAMVYVDTLNVRSEPGVLTEETRVATLDKYDLVRIFEERFAADALWYRVGEDQWVHSQYVRDFSPETRPADVSAHEKWIEINLTQQTLFAHEGDTTVFATLVSTGTPGRETVTGLFQPWIRFQSSPMRGQRWGWDYDYANVPWIVYFHGAYAYHGVYWHDNYGTVQSAGCVNLSPHDAHWVFHWADSDTWVYIHH